MKATKAATRYASSLLQLAQSQGVLEEVKADMETIVQAITDSHELQLMLQSPIIKPDAKQKTLKSIFEKALSKLSMQFIALLTTKGRERIMPQIAEAYIESYKALKGIVTAQVTSATALTAQQREDLKTSLASTGKTIELSEVIDPSIIGGLKIKVGDQRVDASVRRKLNDLKVDISKHKLSAI